MLDIKKIFFKKKILIYGVGKSGLSSYHFLKKNNYIHLYDDNKKIFNNKKLKKLYINSKDINKINFDYIVISPGIDTKKCKNNNFFKKNKKKVITDLDIFYIFYNKNKNITITGTNGKSTTAKLLFEILKEHNLDVRLTGNIGNPILNERKISKKTIFIIEASSYQIEYSKQFKANYAMILNISPDHLERHETFSKYVKSKFKLVKNQLRNNYAFLNINDKFLKREIKINKINCNLIHVNNKLITNKFNKVNNSYFNTFGNQQNLLFIFAISKILKLNKSKIFKIINNFKGLKFRQQIIFNSKKITIINDSKSTSYSSSINILRSLNNVYWIIGGIPKSGDTFSMLKNECKNFKAYIFGNNKNIFINQLKRKLKYECFNNLEKALKKIIFDLNLIKKINKNITILFSPSAASFDNYKNFEDRGKKFNFLIKKLRFKKIINAK